VDAIADVLVVGLEGDVPGVYALVDLVAGLHVAIGEASHARTDVLEPGEIHLALRLHFNLDYAPDHQEILLCDKVRFK